MDRKVILGVGVAAAVGGAAAAAALAYLVFKDDKDGSEGIPHTSSRPVSIDVCIPKKHIAHVIGKRGDTIKEIQRKTNTRINFKDELETDDIRVATIQGQPDEAQLAEILIHQTIANQPRVETLVLMVPCRAMGCIIGKNGENIRSMQNFSKCKIEIERTIGDTPRKVTLMGSGEQIALAKDLIDEKILMVAEKEQLKKDREIYQQKDDQNPVRFNKTESSTWFTEQVDGNAGTKGLVGSDEFQKSKKPSLLYLTSEGGPNDSIEATREPNYRQEELRPTGTDKVIEVYVSSISDPSQFYVQKVGPQSVALDKLVQDMTAYYDSQANQKLNELTKVASGDLVASRFPSDNNWYRARVVDVIVPEDGYDETNVEIDLDFVDFGDCERKPITGAFKLLNEFLNLNFQAIECCLADVAPGISATLDTQEDSSDCLNSKWSEEAADDFERLTHTSHWKVVLAKLVGYKNRTTCAISYEIDIKKDTIHSNTSEALLPPSSSAPIPNSFMSEMIPCVDLVDTNLQQDVNIGRELVRLGHAIYLDGRKCTEENIKDETLKINKPNFDEDECGRTKSVEAVTTKENVEEVITTFVHDLVDSSITQSFEKTPAGNDGKKEKSKLVDTAAKGTKTTRIENTLDSLKALSDTPIKIRPNISNGNSAQFSEA